MNEFISSHMNEFISSHMNEFISSHMNALRRIVLYVISKEAHILSSKDEGP